VENVNDLPGCYGGTYRSGGNNVVSAGMTDLRQSIEFRQECDDRTSMAINRAESSIQTGDAFFYGKAVLL